MPNHTYRWVIELLTTEGKRLGQLTVTPDFGPAVEWTRFEWLRRGGDAHAPAISPQIEPLPHAEPRGPYCRGFRVTLSVNGDAPVSREFPTVYFRDLAQAGAAALVKRGKLREGESFLYLAAAYLQDAEAPTAAPRVAIEELPAPVPLKASRLADYLAVARPFGIQHPADFPVFIPQHVLEECEGLALAAGARETGGLLLGQLHTDAGAGPELFLEITAQLPALHTCAELTSLTFTPETWAAARAARELRGQGEGIYGWHHSHPGRWMCSAECPPEKRRECPLLRDYFSREDHALHATVFGRAYCVALVVTITDTGHQVALFGWGPEGAVRQRGFHILHPSTAHPFPEATPNCESPSHATTCQ